MSEVSQHESGSVSVYVKTTTAATTSDDAMSVTSSRIQPQAPHPTPAHTVAGGVPGNDLFIEKLQNLAVGIEALGRSEKDSKRIESNQSDMSEEYPEASKWDAVAEEDVTRGLQRLVMVAEDEHKENPSKSVEHYYSTRLAMIIAAGSVKFDTAHLKK